jgi:hypothetical protein
MTRFLVSIVVFAVLAVPTFALASPHGDGNEQIVAGAVEMTDTEMDNITAGALLEVTVKNIDVAVQNNDIIKDVNVAAGVAANVLSSGSAALAAAKIK